MQGQIRGIRCRFYESGPMLNHAQIEMNYLNRHIMTGYTVYGFHHKSRAILNFHESNKVSNVRKSAANTNLLNIPQ